MKRGEIWTVAGGKDYAGKPRPALIIQDDRFDATGFFCLSLIDPAPSSSLQPRGYPQLVSIRQLPDYPDACQWEPEGSSLRRLEEAYRFALQERSVQAASQDSRSTVDISNVPPRWRIPVKQISGLNVNGIALDPAHQELMVPTGNGNTVMTFYFPEIF